MNTISSFVFDENNTELIIDNLHYGLQIVIINESTGVFSDDSHDGSLRTTNWDGAEIALYSRLHSKDTWEAETDDGKTNGTQSVINGTTNNFRKITLKAGAFGTPSYNLNVKLVLTGATANTLVLARFVRF